MQPDPHFVLNELPDPTQYASMAASKTIIFLNKSDLITVISLSIIFGPTAKL